MKPRHIARISAVQFLFQCEFNDTEMDTALADFWAQNPTDDKPRQFAERLIHGVLNDRERIDRLLEESAEHWALHRMATVDRNIMRVAIYEMLNCEDIPPIVSINEAVDLAKEMNSRQSGKFVNGILDRIRKGIQRPKRRPGKITEKRRTESTDG